MNEYTSKTVGQLVTERPSRSKVFEAHKIDFCCGGNRPLEEACAKKNLPVALIAGELRAHDDKADETGPDVSNLSMPELIDHIVAIHHTYLKEDLPRLERMAEKVAKVHGDAEQRLHEVHLVFLALEAELLSHLGKEEGILFPMVKRLVAGDLPAEQAAFLSDPMGVMEAEHESAGRALDRLRELTDDYTPPEWACNTFRALFDGLDELERDLHVHIHKENNVLFPRVREYADRMAEATA
jgi:regulator of cell morphogenesis and NO signaling